MASNQYVAGAEPLAGPAWSSPDVDVVGSAIVDSLERRLAHDLPVAEFHFAGDVAREEETRQRLHEAELERIEFQRNAIRRADRAREFDFRLYRFTKIYGFLSAPSLALAVTAEAAQVQTAATVLAASSVAAVVGTGVRNLRLRLQKP